jgi:hypothetical protein
VQTEPPTSPSQAALSDFGVFSRRMAGFCQKKIKKRIVDTTPSRYYTRLKRKMYYSMMVAIQPKIRYNVNVKMNYSYSILGGK